MTHARAVCHNPPRPTLSHSHTISLYALSHCLALSRSHTESRSLSHQLPHGFFLCQRLTMTQCHRLALFRMHLTVCRATGQFDTEPRTAQRTIQRTGSTHCCCSNHCCAHTVLPTTAALATDAPCSTPLITPTTATLILHHAAHHSAHQPLLHQSLLNQPLLHRPLLH